jgi:hypothetical protein
MLTRTLLRTSTSLVVLLTVAACLVDEDDPITDPDAGVTDADPGDPGDAGDAGDPGDPADAGDPGDFVDLSVPWGAPLDEGGGTPNFERPGWSWFPIEDTYCRDGSDNGLYVRFGTVDKVVIYMEGGGACSSPQFCNLNPANRDQQFIAGGESALFSAVLMPIHQQPTTDGIFDFSNPENPFQDWHQVYVPYCTGDVHFGADEAGEVPGYDAGPQKFVGSINMKKFMARIAPTFADAEQVVLTGGSAGAFGAGLNYGMVQDTFGDVPVVPLLDSGPPLLGDYVAACLQQTWRDTWNLNAALPPDCHECDDGQGGGLMNIIDYWRAKYPSATVGLVSSIHDEIIRLFFAAGHDDCSVVADPIGLWLTLATTYPADRFRDGLLHLRETYADTGQLSTYYVSAPFTDTLHQHIFRPRFYEATAEGSDMTMVDWTQDLLNGDLHQVGP